MKVVDILLSKKFYDLFFSYIENKGSYDNKDIYVEIKIDNFIFYGDVNLTYDYYDDIFSDGYYTPNESGYYLKNVELLDFTIYSVYDGEDLHIKEIDKNKVIDFLKI